MSQNTSGGRLCRSIRLPLLVSAWIRSQGRVPPQDRRPYRQGLGAPGQGRVYGPGEARQHRQEGRHPQGRLQLQKGLKLHFHSYIFTV